MLLHPPGKTKSGFIPNANEPVIMGPASGGIEGDVEIRNCLFLNADNYGIQFMMKGTRFKIGNCVFVANALPAVSMRRGDPSKRAQLEFCNNTVLFTRTRTKALDSMGYGLQANTRMDYNIHHNIFGFTCRAAIDATFIDKDRKMKIDNNLFLFNKLADLLLPGGGTLMPVMVDMFEDLEIESAEDNIAMEDMRPLASVVNKPYAAGFLAASYAEQSDLEEDSPANVFREALGFNKRGKISSKVTMYGNRYPFEDAVKLFGAVKGFGAQLPKE